MVMIMTMIMMMMITCGEIMMMMMITCGEIMSGEVIKSPSDNVALGPTLTPDYHDDDDFEANDIMTKQFSK